MKWWVKALIVTVMWFGLTIAAAIVHNMVLHGKRTPQQEQAITGKYGATAGNGTILI